VHEYVDLKKALELLNMNAVEFSKVLEINADQILNPDLRFSQSEIKKYLDGDISKTTSYDIGEND
jgi:hypothetical protein